MDIERGTQLKLPTFRYPNEKIIVLKHGRKCKVKNDE